MTTIIVEPKKIPVPLEFVGVAHSSHPVEIWSRVDGYLNKIAYKEGSFVQAGDLLFQIDPKEFETMVIEAEASLEREKAGLWAAQKALDRYKPLYELKAASRKDLDDATAQVLAAEAAVNLFQGKLDEALLNLGYTSIESPISGLTAASKYREGTLINPGVNGLLTTVYAMDPVWVNIAVSDSYFLTAKREVEKGTLIVPKSNEFEVELILADGSIYPHKGKVSFVSPVLDPDTGTMTARGEFPNPEFELKPGQFVRARVYGAYRPNAIAVPQQAVMQGAGSRFVYIVDKKGQAQVRFVETGDWYKDVWIIRSGLNKGDEVIVSGTNKVKSGSPVKAKKQK